MNCLNCIVENHRGNLHPIILGGSPRPGDFIGCSTKVRRTHVRTALDVFDQAMRLRWLDGSLLREARVLWGQLTKKGQPAQLYLVMKKPQPQKDEPPKMGRPLHDEDGRKRVTRTVSIAAATDDFLVSEMEASGKKPGKIIDQVVGALQRQIEAK